MKELNTFVYQIYPKSFNDTTGNGIGDLVGVIEKLPYIRSLGFDYIWVTPFYKSPQVDNGYDVSDYYQIDPLFGTMADFEMLIKVAAQNELKVMIDIVFNHTSDQHEWFQKALAGDEYYQQYYIFNDKPTNWKSKFGTDAWTYVEKLDKYYLHLFDKSQPDLNWESENVRLELQKIINFWMDKGVKGFRFDVVNLVSKKYPLVDSVGDGREQYTDGPRIHEFLQELRMKTFGDKVDFLTVGEMSSTSIESCLQYANAQKTEFDSVFHFHHLKVDYENGDKWTRDYFDFELLKSLLKDWQLKMDENNVIDTLFWSNHDQPRISSRFIKAPTSELQMKKNKMLAMSMYLLKGISYIYQGEEIGMENFEFDNYDQIVDVESRNFYNLNPLLASEEKLTIISQKSRDNGRTPMQWTNDIYGGFSTTQPWINVNPNYQLVNVQEQLTDMDSTLSFYKKIIKLKKTDLVLQQGNVKFIDHKQLLIFTRQLNDVKYLIICNYYNQEVDYAVEAVKQVIINNETEINGNKLKLSPFASILIEI